MSKTILILFSLLSAGAFYATYTGAGLQGVTSEHKKTVRSHSSFHSNHYSSGGWSYGK